MFFFQLLNNEEPAKQIMQNDVPFFPLILTILYSSRVAEQQSSTKTGMGSKLAVISLRRESITQRGQQVVVLILPTEQIESTTLKMEVYFLFTPGNASEPT